MGDNVIEHKSYGAIGRFYQLIIKGVSYVWPSADGTASQVLQTDGSGNLSWATVSGSAALSTAVSAVTSAVRPSIRSHARSRYRTR